MQSIGLSSIIGDEDLVQALTQTPEALEQAARQATPEKTRIPIPEHLKGFVQPTNINKFIEDIYPNMAAYVGGLLRTKDYDVIDDVINNFVLYMLDTAPTLGKSRYTIFDPAKNLPYYKWFLTNLSFFCRNHLRNQGKAARNFSLSESSYEDTVENPANQAIRLDTLAISEVDPTSFLFVEQIDSFLANYSEPFQRKGQHCFEAHAHYLFRAKMLDEEMGAIAGHLAISQSAVMQWMVKLRKLLLSTYPDSFDPKYGTA